MSDASEKLHTSKLRAEIETAHESIRESFERTLKELLRLQKIVVRPGWTTPAEYLLVKAGIADVAMRMQKAAEYAGTLVDVADRVGRVGGVIIIDG